MRDSKLTSVVVASALCLTLAACSEPPAPAAVVETTRPASILAVGEAATGRAFANAWVICERVIGGEGPATVRGLLGEGFTPGEVRHWYLSAHYRKPLRAAPETLAATIKGS